MKMADFLALLKGVKQDGNQWKALCPGHHDREPSLSFKEADGKILLHCHAGCELEDILKPLGLEPKDLFLDNHKVKLDHREIEAVYHYTDANGKPYEVVRTRPKGFYQRQPDGKGGYINSLKGIVPTLYHQNDLPTAIINNDTIFLVEGEKDCDNLWGFGLVATTNPMGASKWRDSYSEALHSANLVIIPDNDAPGRDHANHIAKSCYGKAAKIRLLELPVKYADISDWLDKGNRPEDLERLIDDCPDYELQPAQMGIKSAQEFIAEQKNKPKVPFLIDQIFPDGKDPMIICGRPQIGKTNLSLYMAFQLADGYPIFDFKTQACKVAYLFMEGGPQQIMDRVEKLARHLRGIPHNLYIQPSDPLPLNPKGQDFLTALVDGIKVCFIDSLKYLIPGDYMKPSDALKGMTALAEVERKTGCRFVLIGHIRKPDRKRVSDPDDYWTELKGPTEYLEICNSALMLSRPRHGDKDSNGRFLLLDENTKILYFIKARDSDRELKPLKLKFYRDELLLKPTIEVDQDSLL